VPLGRLGQGLADEGGDGGDFVRAQGFGEARHLGGDAALGDHDLKRLRLDPAERLGDQRRSRPAKAGFAMAGGTVFGEEGRARRRGPR